VAGWGEYAGVSKSEWIAGPKRVRQQSIRYASGYIQDFDLDVFEHLKVVDFGDAAIPPEANEKPTAANVLRAQAAVEEKVNQALDAGAIPIVIGQNSPCGSYAIAKPIAERSKGKVGVISLDTHWDAARVDRLTMDSRIAGSGSWKRKMYEFHENITVPNLVEIGERGMLEDKAIVREFLARGAHFYPMWSIRTGGGVEWLCGELAHAYSGTEDVYAHFDMDVIGGAGPAPGDILGELAEPIGMTDYEVIRIAHEIGRRGLTGFSFICIPPGSAVIYRLIVYVILYLLAGRALVKRGAVR
jgi:agmatinase